MADKFKPPVEIDLGTNPQRIKFNTVDQAEKWIQAEVTLWGTELDQNTAVNVRAPFLGRILGQQRNSLQQVVRAVNDAKNDPEATVAPDQMLTALNVFETGKVLHSQSSAGRMAIDLFSNAGNIHDYSVACGYLAAAIQYPNPISDFSNRQFHPVDYTAFSSGIAAYRNRVGPGTDKTIKAIDQHVKETFGSWEEQLAIHQNDHFDAVTTIKDKKQKITDEHTRQETEFDELKKSYKTQFSEFEKFYKEGLRAKAPVKYWQLKSWKHSTIGVLLIAAFILGSVGAANFGFQLGNEFSDAIREAISGTSVEAQQSGENAAESALRTDVSVSLIQLAFSKFLVLLVPGFFAVWVLRIVLKVALNNLAIADDARHRVTMVETFLSLMEHTDKLDEADRILMLQSLFRPLPGSSDDDIGPPNWFDVMMQQIKKRS